MENDLNSLPLRDMSRHPPCSIHTRPQGSPKTGQ
jgi:hypothetical protein